MYWLYFLATSAGILDFVIKRWTESNLQENQPVFSTWLLNVMFFQNHGIAFGIPVQRLFSVAIAITLIVGFVYLFARSSGRLKLAGFLVIVGALSNLYDRLIHGYVTDYLFLWGRSAVNLADILILLGIFGYFLYSKSNHSPA